MVFFAPWGEGVGRAVTDDPTVYEQMRQDPDAKAAGLRFYNRCLRFTIYHTVPSMVPLSLSNQLRKWIKKRQLTICGGSDEDVTHLVVT